MIHLTVTDVRALLGDSAFLIDDGTTSILYDTGFAFTGHQIAENIRGVLGSRTLDYIFLSHSHYDHALGSAYVIQHYPQAKVVAGTYAATVFRKPSARAAMRELDRKCAAEHGVYAYEDLIDQLRVDITVNDGDELICGDMRFTIIHLPGHTKCSVGFYLAENRLLLGTETLGVYFGNDIYLPSCLVGYQMALDSFAKAAMLEVDSILLPHYGVVHGEEAKRYLIASEQNTRQTAKTITEMLRSGKTREEAAAYLEETTYSDVVKPVYPVNAFRLNTRIMIERIAKELDE